MEEEEKDDNNNNKMNKDDKVDKDDEDNKEEDMDKKVEEEQEICFAKIIKMTKYFLMGAGALLVYSCMKLSFLQSIHVS